MHATHYFIFTIGFISVFIGHCDPCPEGYFKPVSGKQRCSNKSNIT